jgi:glucokinase
VNIYEFMRDTGVGEESDSLKQAMQAGDPAAAVSMAACDGSDPLAEKAMDTFLDIYGAQAGNLALTCLANGGAYVAGGIAPKIIDKLKNDRFIKSFNAKGRMAKLMVNMPVKVVINARVGLLGAALAASRL